MNQALMSQIKNLIITNRTETSETIQANVTGFLDNMIQNSQIYDYNLSIENERIIVSIKRNENSVFYAFQVNRP